EAVLNHYSGPPPGPPGGFKLSPYERQTPQALVRGGEPVAAPVESRASNVAALQRARSSPTIAPPRSLSGRLRERSNKMVEVLAPRSMWFRPKDGHLPAA